MIIDTQSITTYLHDKYFELVAVVACGTAIWVKIMRPALRWGFRTAEIVSKLDQLISEVTPNGGGSMRDAINRIEANQITTEERVKVLLLDSSDVIWESDISGNWIWANQTLLSLIGLDLEDVIAHGWIVAIPELERERVVREWQLAVEDKREFRLDFSFQNSSNKKTKVTAKAWPLRRSGKLYGWIGIAKEIKDEVN
jgi:PAS domain S-box-containing protein